MKIWPYFVCFLYRLGATLTCYCLVALSYFKALFRCGIFVLLDHTWCVLSSYCLFHWSAWVLLSLYYCSHLSYLKVRFRWINLLLLATWELFACITCSHLSCWVLLSLRTTLSLVVLEWLLSCTLVSLVVESAASLVLLLLSSFACVPASLVLLLHCRLSVVLSLGTTLSFHFCSAASPRALLSVRPRSLIICPLVRLLSKHDYTSTRKFIMLIPIVSNCHSCK